jgi:glutamate synthase domain-containing protein 2
MGMPLRGGLTFVHAALVGTNLREKIKLGASGKITTAFDMARVMALGADWCNAARGFMFAVGCIQSQQCHTDRCPTGVATQDRTRQRARGSHRRRVENSAGCCAAFKVPERDPGSAPPNVSVSVGLAFNTSTSKTDPPSSLHLGSSCKL